MIVFDLRCGNAHVFEAWFGSSRDYDDQRARGLLACPLCGDDDVTKAVMAPNLSAKGSQAGAELSLALAPGGAPGKEKAMLAALARMQAKALEGSTWVGADFADNARAMHLGESEKRAIHGQATVEQARALADDGVPVSPLPMPITPPDTLN